jgi:hypothetical protein
VSQRSYKNEAAFRREIERRLGDHVPDRIWGETGEYIWRDQQIERGYAVESALDFALIELRHRRKTGDLPPSPQQRLRDPRDAQLWGLRSRFVARLAEPYAGEWRRRFLPYSLDAGAFTLRGENGSIVTKSREGPLGPDEFRTWLALLVQAEGGDFLAKPLVGRGPHPLVASDATLMLFFPSATPPRFLEPDRLPPSWWSGSDADSKGELEILGISPEGGACTLQPNYWGGKTLQALAAEARWLGSGNWDLAGTVGFFLFGATPLLSPMGAAVTQRFDETGWGARITLFVDPRVSADEVEDFYRELQRDKELRLRPAIKAKGFSRRVGTLLEFVLARWQPGSKPEWSDLWREWQQSYGRSRGWAYASPAVVARVVNRALAALGKELWPAS